MALSKRLGIFSFLGKKRTPATKQARREKKVIAIAISKRQKFVIAVVLLSLGLFFVGNIQTYPLEVSIRIALPLAILTNIFFLWSVYSDLRENFVGSVFILPFFYSLALGLFYFLVPDVLMLRFIISVLYAVGLYSVYLSQNVFVVASIRTIPLLGGARIVSFLITLLSYYFISVATLSLHLSLLPMGGILFIYTYLLVYQSIRTYVMQKSMQPSLHTWVFGITLCLVETAMILWFWPSGAYLIALFLLGFFSTLVGLSHVWFEKRLFRGVLWEYLWLGVLVFFVLIAFTRWGN